MARPEVGFHRHVVLCNTKLGGGQAGVATFFHAAGEARNARDSGPVLEESPGYRPGTEERSRVESQHSARNVPARGLRPAFFASARASRASGPARLGTRSARDTRPRAL